jgi:hypothetical protein
MKRIGLLSAVVAVIGFVAVASALAEEGARAPGRPIAGELTKIDGKVLTITVKREGATSEEKATVEDSTEVFSQAAVKVEDVKVGDRVRIVQGEKRLFGEVTKVDGKTLTLKSRRGEEQTVTVDDSTKITASVKGKFEDLKVGQQIMVFQREGKTVRIEIRPAPEKRPAEK